MKIQVKIVQKIGELFMTEKGGGIQEFVASTSDGIAEVFKFHASAKELGFLTALKSGDVVSCKYPENFVFVSAKG